ncbi:hypothetical protein A2U01_0019284, partial [Trifolium medium]|nr:hypothetical protein [Trifolium medium]
EALLLTHEARLEKGKKRTLEDVASINIAQTSTTDAPVQDQNTVQPSVNNSYGPDPHYNPNFGSSRAEEAGTIRVVVEEMEEAYGPYPGQNFPPDFGRNYDYGFPNFPMWSGASSQPRPAVPFAAPTAMLANASPYNPSTAWYPNSGASYHDTKEILLQGNVGADGLYSFSNISIVPAKSYTLSSLHKPIVCSVTSKSTVSNSSLSLNTQHMWHLRLGHPNNQTLKLAL